MNLPQRGTDMAWNKGAIPQLIFGVGLTICTTVWAEPTTKAKTAKVAKADAGALAVVDGKVISKESFLAEMASLPGDYTATRKEQLLDGIVRSELLFAAARNAGYEKDPEVIAAIKQTMVNKYLKDNLEPKLAKVTATDQEAQAYYKSHQGEFGTLAMTHVAIITVASSSKYSAEKKAELLKRAEKARVEALTLAPGVPGFGGVAATYSEHQASRYRGGDIGWLPADGLDAGFDKKVSDAISALTIPGQVSSVITAPDGYYLAKLIETKGASVKPFARVKDGARYRVVQEKKQRLEREFIERLKEKIPVAVNSGLLQTISLPAQPMNAGPPLLPAR